MELEETKTKEDLKLEYDGQISLAIGRSKKEIKWKNKNMLWSELVNKLSTTIRTQETEAEYKKMAKVDRDNIKDVGGFVGGTLKGGRRKSENVANRTLLTLDLDYANNSVWDSITMLNDYACLIYSTHSHTSQNPRYRLIIPLSQPVLPDEYQAIARMVANDIGIDMFDDTTYQPHRLMYFPSTSSDAEYIFKYQDGEWLDPQEILNRYLDWKDVSYWPESSRERKNLDTRIGKQEDPLTKDGIVGAFCRTYSISEAIEEFLSDVYSSGIDNTRYTYLQGSTSGGVVVYEDKFSYSHHGTDPTSGILCNSFDLVRIHRFGELDEDARIDTKINNLPSFKAMTEFALKDNNVKIQIGEDNLAKADDDFKSDIEEKEKDDNKWLRKLTYTKQGKIESTINNAKLILENDRKLKGKFSYNEFSMRTVVRGELPWNKDARTRPIDDTDESGLRHYLEKVYGITRATSMIQDATKLVTSINKFHPIKDYLNNLEWDGIERINTLFTDYFGTEDNIYTRAASRIFMCGGIARIYNPGCQLDYMVSLVGDQGIGKGTFYRLMAKHDEWFTELTTIKAREAIEETMGKWIVEMAEMTPNKRSEVEEIKAFITNKSKTVRLAYAHNPIDVLRQYVLVASTNEFNFLKDTTGNRRYLPIDTDMEKANKDIRKDLKNEVDMLWAEAKELYKKDGFKCLILSEEEEALAKEEQENHRIIDDEEGTIIEYLDTYLPNNWYEKSVEDRRLFFNDELSAKPKEGEGFIRDRICVKELMYELYGQGGKIDPRDSARINKILQGLSNWYKQKSPIKIKGYGLQRGFYRKE